MQTKGRIFDDLARVANGAVTTLVGIKGEVDAVVRQRVERLLSDADLVPRDEFEAVKAMAANARAEQEALQQRVADLESRLAAAGTLKMKAKAKAKPRAAAKAKPRAAAKAKTTPRKRGAPKPRAGTRKRTKKA